MKIKPEYIFPMILILIDFASASVYFFNSDYKKCVYWIAAAILNAAVTF